MIIALIEKMVPQAIKRELLKEKLKAGIELQELKLGNDWEMYEVQCTMLSILRKLHVSGGYDKCENWHKIR